MILAMYVWRRIEEAAAAVSIFGKTRALALALALDLARSLSLSRDSALSLSGVSHTLYQPALAAQMR